jgi:hypothetical protein
MHGLNMMLLAEQTFHGSSLNVSMVAEVKFASLHLAQKCCILLVCLLFSFHSESKTAKLGLSSLMKSKGAETIVQIGLPQSAAILLTLTLH